MALTQNLKKLPWATLNGLSQIAERNRHSASVARGIYGKFADNMSNQYAEPHFRYGKLLHMASDYKSAVVHLEIAANTAGYSRSDVHYYYASALLEVGAYPEAEVVLLRCTASSPSNADYQYKLGVVLCLQRKWSEAEKVLEKCLAMGMRHRNLYKRLGQASYKNGNYHAAHIAYVHAAEMWPKRKATEKADLYYKAAICNEHVGGGKTGVKLINRAVNLSDRYETKLYGYGPVYEAYRLYDKAEAMYMEASRDDHYIREYVLFKLGTLYLLQKRYIQAVRELSKAIEADGTNPTWFIMLGYAYEGTGDYRQAANKYSKAIEINKGDSPPHWYTLLITSHNKLHEQLPISGVIKEPASVLAEKDNDLISLESLVNHKLYSHALKSILDMKDAKRTSNSENIMSEAFKILMGLLEDSKTPEQTWTTILTLIKMDTLNFALELSMLRKLDRNRYEVIKRLVNKNYSDIPIDKQIEIAALDLSIERHEDLTERGCLSLIALLSTLTTDQLARLFRFPAFHNNADMIKNLISEGMLARQDVSDRGAFAIFVLGYVILDDRSFDSMISILKRRYLPIENEVPKLNTAGGALQGIIHKYQPQGVSSAIEQHLDGEHRLKIALCISGQLRGYEQAYPTWARLGLDKHEVDVYIHTWKSIGRRFPDPKIVGAPARVFGDKNFVSAYKKCAQLYGINAMQAAYPILFNGLQSTAVVSMNQLKSVYGKVKAVVIDDEEQFSAFNNREKMHYKLYKAHEMVKESGKQYDLIIRIRPDMNVLKESTEPNWHNIARISASKKVIYAEEPPGLREKLVMGDQLAVGVPELINVYADAWNEVQVIKNRKDYGVPKKFSSHATLAFQLLYNGIRSEKLSGVCFGPLLEMNTLTKEDILELITPDISRRSTKLPMDEILMKSLGKVKQG